MIRRDPGSALLVCWGVVVLVGGVVLYDPSGMGGVAGGLRWLALLTALLLGGGLLLSGVLTWRHGRTYGPWARLPALVLVGTGLLAIGGGPVILRPGAYDGLAGGLRLAGLAAFTVGGGLLVLVGGYSYQNRVQRVPLAVLASLTGAGAFAPLDSSGVLLPVGPLVWTALVVLFVCGPPLAVFYGWGGSPSHEPMSE